MLITTTIFLPQFLMASRNARSDLGERPVGGGHEQHEIRAAARTRVVSRSCSRKIALVPGVSTMVSSLSSETGALMTSAPDVSAPRCGAAPVPQDLQLRRRRRDALFEDPGAHERIHECALAGVELADDDEQEEAVRAARWTDPAPIGRRWARRRGPVPAAASSASRAPRSGALASLPAETASARSSLIMVRHGMDD